MLKPNWTALWVAAVVCALGTMETAQAARWKDGPKPIYLSFKADQSSIQPGQAVTLSWAASEDVRCKAYGGWEGRKPGTGTHRVSSLTASTEFGLECGKGRNKANQTVFVDVAQAEPTPPPPPANDPPLISAGLDQRITLPNAAALNGVASDDGLPNGATTTSWRTVSGPGNVVFANPGSASTTASFSVEGSYTLRLTASDGELSVSDDMQVFVSPAAINQAPLVSAGGNQNITLPDAARLAGQVSDDGLPGDSMSIRWQMVSGPGNTTFGNANAASTSVAFSSEGDYVLRLSASDGELSNYDEVSINVQAQNNTPPTVAAGDDQTVTLPDTISLQGQVSDDGVPGTGTSVRWSVVSGPDAVEFGNPMASSTTAAFTSEGIYVLRLSANDGELNTYDDLTVQVAASPAENTPPIVTAGTDQQISYGDTASFTGSADDDGLPNDTLTLQWSVVQGPGPVTFNNDRNPQASADFSVSGNYLLRLTASDGELDSYDDVAVIVGEAPLPTVSLSVDQPQIDLGDGIQLSWSSQHAASCEASGDWDGSKALQGNHYASPTQYATYTLSCQGGGQNVTRMVSVLVRNLNLSWQAPEENVDGTPLTDLAGYRVYVVNGGQYELAEDITSPSTTSTHLAMPSGEYELAMTAYDLEGNESSYSNSVTKISP